MGERFKGTVNVDIRDSVPDWDPFVQAQAPAGSPNVRFHSTPAAAPARSSQAQAGPPVRNFPGSETTAVAAGGRARDAPPAPAGYAASPLTPPLNPAGQAAQPGPLNLAQLASRLAPPKDSNGGPPINIAG